MIAIDWIIVFAYLIFSCVIGVVLSSRNSNQNDYFVALCDKSATLHFYDITRIYIMFFVALE